MQTPVQVHPYIITPDIARELIRRNTKKNRPVRNNHLNKMAESMRRGEWMLTHQAIGIDWNGELLDGQHRLISCMMSETAIPLMVATNCDPKSFIALDQGARRSISDVLGGNRLVNETVTRIARIGEGSMSQPSPAVVERYAQFFGLSAEAVQEARSGCVARITAAGMRAAVAVRHALGDGDYALDFYKKIAARELDDLPSVGRSFLMRALENRLPNPATNEFCGICWYATSERNKDIQKITLKNPLNHYNSLQDAIRGIMKTAEKLSRIDA